MRCAVVINRGSGAVKELWDASLHARLDEALRANGWEPHFHLVQGDDVRDLVREAVQSGAQAVLAGGGDGTTRCIAAELQGTDVPLGVLPFGTLNLAARDLGSPLDLVEAVRALHPGVTRRIDLLRVNAETCLCMFVLGFYPNMMAHQPEYHGRNWWLKTWRFASSLWRSYFHTPKLNILMTLPDGRQERVKTRFLAVVPGEYQDVLGLVPRRENLASGHCTVYTSRHRSRYGVLRVSLRYLLGRARHDPDLQMFNVRALELTVTAHRTVLAAIDGEILRLAVPIALELLPKALTVLQPVAGAGAVEARAATSVVA